MFAMPHRIGRVPVAPRVFLLAALVLALAGGGGCSRLIPNYEVLPLPAGGQGYTVGARWIEGLGTSGDALAPDNVEVFDGVDHLQTADTHTASTALQVPVLKWISGSLGLASDKSLTIDFKGLKHTRVKDAYPLTTTKTALWEAVTADAVNFTLTDSTSSDLTAEVVADKLIPSAPGSISLKVASTGGHSFSITAAKPLVIAIRVVSLNYTESGGSAPFDLTQRTQGTPQRVLLGYEVSHEDQVDPLARKVKVNIRNDGLPQFKGVTTVFDGSTPWVNPNREALAQIDPQAAAADYVWDLLSITWVPDLAKCQLKTVRQYIRVRTADSGLSGTK